MSDQLDNVREASATVFLIGAVDLGSGKELRFVRYAGDPTWRPDILVDHNTRSVARPPECFVPSQATLDLLDETLALSLPEFEATS